MKQNIEVSILKDKAASKEVCMCHEAEYEPNGNRIYDKLLYKIRYTNNGHQWGNFVVCQRCYSSILLDVLFGK